MASNPYELYTDLVAEVGMSKTGFVSMGKLLKELKENDTYLEATGEGVETWQAFLAQPEIGLSISEANRLIQIYEVFIEQYQFGEDEIVQVPIKNLHTLLPIVKKGELTQEEVEGLMQDAGSLSQRDFRERVQEYKNDDGLRTYTYMIMRRCNETGNMRKVHDISTEEILLAFGHKLDVGQT